LFVFVLLSTAYRWGLRETLWMGAASMLILDAQAIFVMFRHDYIDIGVEVNRLIFRNAYLLLAAFLVGYLAENEKKQRARTVTLATLLSQVNAGSGLRQSLHAVLDRLVTFFGARSAVIVFEETGTHRRFIATTRPRLATDTTFFHVVARHRTVTQESQQHILQHEFTQTIYKYLYIDSRV
jgi:hypothetical protein